MQILNLDQKDNSNSIFDIIYPGKSRTFICSSFISGEIAIFSDWGGNTWCINVHSKKKSWEQKIKKPILFEFVEYSGMLFAFNECSMLSIDVNNGDIRELLSFKTVTSVARAKDKIYLNERSKNGFDSQGQIVEINLADLSKKIIYKEEIKRTFGPLYRKEIASTGSEILFYADKSIFSYSSTGENLKILYTNSQVRDRMDGLTMSGSILLFIPCIKNENAGTGHFPKNPDINAVFFLKPTGEAGPLDLTAVMTTTCYEGSSVELTPGNFISTLGSYVFFNKDGVITKKDVPDRRVTGTDCKLFRQDGKTYLFEPRSFGDRAEETGFRLYTIDENDFSIQPIAEFKTNKRGRNFKGCYFDFFGDTIVVRSDGRCYVLKMRITHGN
jgi:hypothetical protein